MIFYLIVSLTSNNLTSAVSGFYCMPEYIGKFLAKVSAFDTGGEQH